MLKHTPGPWREVGNFVVTSNGTGAICRMSVSGPIGYAAEPASWENEANARLIAAAPDLLAALESWIACANDGDRHPPAWIDVFNACAAQSRAAIARARGEA